jgi:hypothetical protein
LRQLGHDCGWRVRLRCTRHRRADNNPVFFGATERLTPGRELRRTGKEREGGRGYSASSSSSPDLAMR